MRFEKHSFHLVVAVTSLKKILKRVQDYIFVPEEGTWLLIQAVQNFAARIISNTMKYDQISPILNWLPVRQHLYYRHAIMAFKCMTGCAPDSLFSEYTQRASITKRTTRNSLMLQIPLPPRDKELSTSELLNFGTH